MPITKERKLEILDKTIAHFKAQQAYGFDKITGKCRYRTYDGNKCAAGFWIPDATYLPEMEGAPLLNPDRTDLDLPLRDKARLIIAALEAGGIVGKEELSFLREIQNRHDEGATSLPFDEFLVDLDCKRSRIAAEATPPSPPAA